MREVGVEPAVFCLALPITNPQHALNVAHTRTSLLKFTPKTHGEVLERDIPDFQVIGEPVTLSCHAVAVFDEKITLLGGSVGRRVISIDLTKSQYGLALNNGMEEKNKRGILGSIQVPSGHEISQAEASGTHKSLLPVSNNTSSFCPGVPTEILAMYADT